MIFTNRITMALMICLLLSGNSMSGLNETQVVSDSSENKALLAAIEKGTVGTQDGLLKLVNAIKRVGELKITESVPLLIQRIELMGPTHNEVVNTPYSMYDGRVAVEALIAIGDPAVQPILDAARLEKQRHRLALMAAAIRGIKGRHGGVSRVTEEMKKGYVEEELKRLEKLSAFVEKPPML